MSAASVAAATASASAGGQRFRVAGMDCASCARTVERVVEGLEGVREATVSFGNATLVVDGDVESAAVQAAVRRAGYSAEPAGRRPDATAPFWRRSARTASTTASALLLLAALAASLSHAPPVVSEPLYLLSIGVGGWPIAHAAVAALRRRALDMNVLMTMAAVGAVGISEYAEAAWVVVLFSVGTTLERLALERSRRSVEALMDLAPAEALLVADGIERAVPVEAVPLGAIVLIRPGERLPLDGVVEQGASSVDESALTGESVPVDKEPGDHVFAGTLNAYGALRVRVTSSAADSTLARLTQLVTEAQGSRAPSERFVDRFARVYTPLVFAAALLVAIVPPLLGGELDTWLYRALALLIVACPCALVISVPVSVVSAIGGAARRGVLIKGGQALEDLGGVRAVALDKTGTLTEGRPELVDITTVSGITELEALTLMAAVERSSEHPLAVAIARTAREQALALPDATSFQALPGRGAVATIAGRRLWAGGPRLAVEQGASLPDALEAVEAHGQTAVLLGEGTRVLAVFGLADRPRPHAQSAVRALGERAGVEHVVMLTGDSERVARTVASLTGVTEWRAGLLPEDKLAAVRDLAERHGPTAMVGDGVNDAPALAGATVGVAMGAAGSDVALESADVALMGDELERLPDAIRHSRRALAIMRQNVVVSLATKAVFVALAPAGYVTLIVAVAADMGVSLLVTLNGLRLLRGVGAPSNREPRSGATPAEASTAVPSCCATSPFARTANDGSSQHCDGALIVPVGDAGPSDCGCGPAAEPARAPGTSVCGCDGDCCSSVATEAGGASA
ncbi:heavy metal translocating P-type ATPase [Miltoncostaea marina]|uniref:heavy metal translocating P-type ATPase n=1 Tax=Miltoncostaea marina TaxID=2843215 RepID=UPI001C3E24D5|nr:cation-translocating P-type ATPase [Miltoncostaea marina]